MGPAEIRSVLSKSPEGQQIMKSLMADSEKEWSSYKQSKQDYQGEGA